MKSALADCNPILVMATAALLVACGGETVDSEPTPKGEGAVILQIVAPDLWPPSPGLRLELTRGPVGGLAEVVGSYSKVPEQLKVIAIHDTPAWVGAQLIDAQGHIVAIGRTVSRVIADDDPDRQETLFLHGKDKALPLYQSNGQPLSIKARVGSTATVVNDGTVVVIGGGSPVGSSPCHGGPPTALSDELLAIAGHDHSVSTLAKLKMARAYHQAAPLPGGRIGVFGGYVAGGVSTDVEVFQVNQKTLAPSANPLKFARARHCIVALDNRVIVIGGDGPGAQSAEIWRYGEGSIASTTLYAPRRHPHCELVTNPADGALLILVVGGLSPTGFPVQYDEVLKLDGDNLVNYGTLVPPNPVASLEIASAINAPFGILRAGGLTSTGATDRMTWIDMTAPTTTWKMGPVLSEARGCAAQGRVGVHLIAAGGLTGSQNNYSSALDSIDLADKSSKSVGLPMARAGGWIVTKGDGVALIGGGTSAALISFVP